VSSLKAGDPVALSGIVYTSRDKGHKRILEYIESGRELPFNPKGALLFHAGPLMKKNGDNWLTVALGPTTSTRVESMVTDILNKTPVSGFIGKSGFTRKPAQSLAGRAVYLAMTGGAAALGASHVKKVVGEEWMDLGMPEALWILELDALPLTVAIDSHGKSLYDDVRAEVTAQKRVLFPGD